MPWNHITTLLDKVEDPAARSWYAAEDVRNGSSQPVQTHHISTDRHSRVGAAHDLDFLALEAHHSERDLENAPSLAQQT